MNLDELLSKMPEGATEAAKQHGQALQVKMFQFLARQMSGETKFAIIEAANVEGCRQYLRENAARIINWSMTYDTVQQKYVLLTEEVD